MIKDSLVIDSRDVAQPGSAHAWGAWGRWFKSTRPDHLAIPRTVYSKRKNENTTIDER